MKKTRLKSDKPSLDTHSADTHSADIHSADIHTITKNQRDTTSLLSPVADSNFDDDHEPDSDYHGEIWLSQVHANHGEESFVESAGEQKLARGPISLRPLKFSEYVGQKTVCQNLQIACSAAKERGEALDHVLLHGPPGLGKTSLARILATERGVDFKSTSGPVIERPGDLAAILSSLNSFDILFIDELHRLPRVVEEVLYPAMEDFQLDILIGQGPAARSIKIDLPPFTLVGATTRSGLLTSPLRDRFGLVLRLEFYDPQALAQIVIRSAKLLNINLEQEAALEIGRRSRGTPRIANRLLKRVRDFVSHNAANYEVSNGNITQQTVADALKFLNVDKCGLDNMDREILRLVIEKFKGGPVGIDTIAAALGEDRQTIEDVYEPYLLQEGFIARTRQGRVALDNAYKHLESLVS